MTVVIAGRQHTLTADDVVRAVRYRRPDYGGIRPGVTWYAIVNRRKVPAKWALRMTLGISGTELQTNQAVSILTRLGFQTGREQPAAQSRD